MENQTRNSMGTCKFCRKLTRDAVERENGSIFMWLCMDCLKDPKHNAEIDSELKKDDRKPNFGRG